MKILVVGSGAREHAICLALTKSEKLSKLFAMPGNAGISEIAECVEIDIFANDQIIEFCQKEAIDLVVVGPEAPLVNGIVDALEAANIRVFGPTKAAAQLESSKGFTKELCKEYNIPTADYQLFSSQQLVKEYLAKANFPIVIKMDGLAAGKGVVIANNLQEANDFIEQIFNEQVTDEIKVVIEEYLEGREVSFFALCDGTKALFFATSEDYKRVGDGDVGPNTGGMGSISPSNLLDEKGIAEVMERIINPTIYAMNEKNIPYKGVLFAGLMLTKNGPKLLEYNTRFGDPETQSMLVRLDSDLIDILCKICDGKLTEEDIKFKNVNAVSVVMASIGYPGDYKKGSVISGLGKKIPNINYFHAATKKQQNQVIATGGRVITVTSLAKNLDEARVKAYQAIEEINWPEGFYRKDIGKNC
jgi:phosphoribosylamine--glycine ligase